MNAFAYYRNNNVEYIWLGDVSITPTPPENFEHGNPIPILSFVEFFEVHEDVDGIRFDLRNPDDLYHEIIKCFGVQKINF